MPGNWPRAIQTVPRLVRGSRVAIVSPSSGLAPLFPNVYSRGLDVIRELGLEPVEFPTARMTSEELYASPEARVSDLHRALVDESIDGVIASIGGYESIRLLPLLKSSFFSAHPKLLLGGSDATTFLLFARRAGLVSFYGPSVMAGFSQAHDLPSEFLEHVESFLFGRWQRYEYSPYPSFSHGYTGWDKTGRGGVTSTVTNKGWSVLHGDRSVRGHLWGGCIEVVEFFKGTGYWPPRRFFQDAVLYFETSEEKPSPDRVGYMLRNYGVAGILDRAAALLVGRPKDYTDAENKRLHELIRQIAVSEFGADRLVIIADVDIGHTDPKWIVPNGMEIEIDPTGPRIVLTNSPFSA